MTGDLDQVLTRIVDEVEAHSPGLVFVDSFRSVVFASENAGQPDDQPAAVRPATGHAADELAGDDLPGRRVLQRDRRQPGLHGGRRSDLAAPERAAQLDGAQDGGHEDARPGDAARAAHLPHRPQPVSRSLPRPTSLQRAAPSLHAAVHGARAAHGRAGAGRHARRRPAARLLAARGRAFRVGQEHPGRAFLAEGVRRGETGVIAAFEQRPQPIAQSRARRPGLHAARSA